MSLPSEIFRINVREPKAVEIMYWGWEKPDDSPSTDDYTVTVRSVDLLPEWMQRRLAVLTTIDPERRNTDIPGVGRRVSTYVYWIYPEPHMTGQAGIEFDEYTRRLSKAPST